MKIKKLSTIITFLLLVGIVDQVNDNVAIVEYSHGGSIKHTEVNLDLSACDPIEGQTVYFYKDYKIVSCEERTE